MPFSFYVYECEAAPDMGIGEQRPFTFEEQPIFPSLKHDQWLKYTGISSVGSYQKYVFHTFYVKKLPPDSYHGEKVIPQVNVYIHIDILFEPNRKELILKDLQLSPEELNKLGFNAQKKELLNLVKLKQKFENSVEGWVKGGWFRNLEFVDVDSGALFGDRVVNSEQWKRFNNKGELSSLLLRLKTPEGDEFSCWIRSDHKYSFLFPYEEALALERYEYLMEIISDKI